ncbi:MAG TPA: gfo/Idh/MocA family oxidoreductase, partial [Flavobacterium alvei]|nr:gfo/Idh/MocA family oxidoreductase [Flavobacterium alvei]
MKKISRRKFVHNFGLGVGSTAVIASLPSFMTLSENSKNLYDGKKLNIALCGLGRYAGYLAEGLEISKYCRLAGVVTGTPSKALDWGKKYNIPEKNIYNYQNFDEIIHNKDIDLVYVVLP